MVPKEQLTLLRQFITIIKANPKILYSPDLTFFKDWLLSLGAKIPDAPTETKAEPQKQEENDEKSKDEEMPDLEEVPPSKPEELTPEPEEESEDEEIVESDIELEELDEVIKDELIEELDMGDENIEVTDEMMEESSSKRSEAMAAMSEGNLDVAIQLFTEAITKNPHSANLYAKRACALTKAKRPGAAIKDCEKALSINQDSAQPYKWRGRAYRLLGKYEEAYHDFQTACRLDFDETSFEWQKEVEKNAKKIMDHRRKYERLNEEMERNRKIKAAKKRKEEAQREYEREKKKEEERQKSGGFPGGMPKGFPGGMPGGMGGFPGGGMPGGGMPGGMPGGAAGGMPDISSLLSDPELVAAMQDPDVMAAFQDVSKNPANMSKYQDNPKIKSVIEKLQKKFGGAGGAPPH